MPQRKLDPPSFLSRLPARPIDYRLALAVIVVSALIFAIVVPFAKIQLPVVLGFIPTYQSALATNDLITAVLLYAQFGLQRSRALLWLAAGYLFTAAMAVVHALTFPGLFAPDGLLGAGPQSTAWLYMFWHGVFPIMAIGYALTKGRNGGMDGAARPTGRAIALSIGAVAAGVRGADLARDRGWRGASPDHARPRLYARADRRRVDGVAAEPRGARGAVAAPPALRARRLADGRDGSPGCSTSRSPRCSTPGVSTSASMRGGSMACWPRASCSSSCCSKQERSTRTLHVRSRSSSKGMPPGIQDRCQIEDSA